MNDEERSIHRQKMYAGLAAIINLMPTTTEVGAVSLLDMGLRAICAMRDDDDIPVAEAQTMRVMLVKAFQTAHPRLDTDLNADLSILNDVIAQVINAPMADDELVQLARKTMREFREHGLNTVH